VIKFLQSQGIENVDWVEQEEIDGSSFQRLEFSHLYDRFKVGRFGLCNKILTYKEPQKTLIPTSEDLRNISLNYWGATPQRYVSQTSPPKVSDIVQTIAENRQRRLDDLAEKKVKRDKKLSTKIDIKDVRVSKRGKSYLISLYVPPSYFYFLLTYLRDANTTHTWQGRSSIPKRFLPDLDAFEKNQTKTKDCTISGNI
jgi:hypothetical protein